MTTTSQTFPARFEELEAICAFGLTLARRVGMDELDAYNLQLVLDEAASNIIEHAYAGRTDGRIEVEADVRPDSLTIRLRDFGVPFDPDSIPAPNVKAPLTERGVGGLGVFIMRNLMDEVHYATSPEGGNVVTLMKRFQQPRPPRLKPKRKGKASWRDVLNLGDAMLGVTAFADQCAVISNTASELVEGEIALWLNESFFRLPNWTTERIYLPEPAGEPMRTAWQTLRTTRREERQSTFLAVPIHHQDLPFGVVRVRRDKDRPFKPREVELLEGLARYAGLALLVSHRIAVERFRLEQLNLVRTVSAQIVNLYDPDELARRVTQLIQSTFKYYYVAIFSLEPAGAGNKLRFRASAGARRKGKKAPMLEVALGQGLIGTVAETGEEVVSNDISKEPLFRHIDSLPETKSETVIPLKIAGRVLGVLDIQSDTLNAIHPNDLLVLHVLADNIAIALEEARVYRGLERRADAMAVVADVGRAVTSILNLRKMMERVAELIFERLGFQYVHLFTVHPNRRQIIYEAGGTKSQALEGFVLDLDDPAGVIPWVARQAETAFINDLAKDLRHHLSPLPPSDPKAELCVPLKFNNQVVGVLDVQSNQLNAFTEEDRQLFEALGDSIAAAIHNADLYRSEQWRRQVSDSLREVAGLLSANASLDQVLDAILTELERNLPADISAIWLMNDEDLYCAAVHGARAADLETVKRAYPEVNAWLAKALLARKPVIHKVKDSLGPAALVGNFNANHSSIAAPLRIGEQAVGILSLTHHTAGRYGHEAQAMTTTFASYAAVAIENARLYDSAQEQAYASAALLQVAQAVVSLSSLDDILATIVRVLPILVGVERAVLYRCDAETDAFVPVQEYGLPDEALPVLWRPIPGSEFPLLSAAKEYNQHILSEEAHRGPEHWLAVRPASEEDVLFLLQSDERLLMAFPLNIKDACFGVLLIEEALGGRRFRSRRIEILTGVAQQAALAIQNDLFAQESRIRERLETEVELARQIQKTFIPEYLPKIPAWDLDARWQTARQVGGDFYDVFELPNNRLGLFIADVADKGMPAALFMALTRTLVRAAVQQTISPAEALSRVNRLLYPDAQQGMFVTAVYGVLDTRTGVFTYANAGHNPPLWIQQAGARMESLTRTGIALGVLESVDVEQRSIHLEIGDELFFYTDGVTEAFSPAGEMFGETRLLDLVRSSSASAADLLDRVDKAVNEFLNSDVLSDDITMIAVKRLA